MEALTYNAKEVMELLKCSRATAYRVIDKMNKIHWKKNKLDLKDLSSGKSRKKLFHEYYPKN